jgi:hypothetical protein
MRGKSKKQHYSNLVVVITLFMNHIFAGNFLSPVQVAVTPLRIQLIFPEIDFEVLDKIRYGVIARKHMADLLTAFNLLFILVVHCSLIVGS